MLKHSYPFLGAVLALASLSSVGADLADPGRGRMLYDNQCIGCHESLVHIREDRRVHSLAGVWWQTTHWAREMRLGWQPEEGADVSQYLYRTYYEGGAKTGAGAMNMTLTSSAFADKGEIPSRFTCDGKDVSPELSWSGVPPGTRSLALIVDDPDAPDPAAPRMTWVHWVLYNLPADSRGLPEAVDRAGLPAGTRQGLNDWKRTGFGGPCPPIGRHRYYHKLYALDALLPDLHQPTKAQLEKAMQRHILGYTELLGTYQRK